MNMDLRLLVGKIFDENEIFQLLRFDIEENFKFYLKKYIHIYFNHLDNRKIKINEVVFLYDDASLFAVNRQIIGTKAWIEIYNNSNHIDLTICRKDRSAKYSAFGPNLNYQVDIQKNSYRNPEMVAKLSPEEIREAFAELSGLFETRPINSDPKKPM